MPVTCSDSIGKLQTFNCQMGPSANIPGDLETHMLSDSTLSGTKNVCFNPLLRVILVPSRVEYKCAGLCPILWWTSSDFFSFQQSAHSEVRLLSAFENIGGREARKKLYQPNHTVNAELDVLENMCATSDDYYLSDEEKDDISDNEDPYDELLANDGRSEECSDTNNSPGMLTQTAFHKVSSLDCISASLRHAELPVSEMGRVPTNSSAGLNQSSRMSWEESDELDEDSHLQLCVPLTQPRLLNTECGSSGRSRRSKKAFTSTTIALCSTFLLIIFVLVDRYGPAYLSKVS